MTLKSEERKVLKGKKSLYISKKRGKSRKKEMIDQLKEVYKWEK